MQSIRIRKLINKVLSERDYGSALRTKLLHRLRVFFTFRELLCCSSYNDKTLVDLGCSEGTYSIIFDKLGFKVTSVDIIKEDLEILRKLGKKYTANCRVLNGAIDSDDFLTGEKFDYVFCSEVIEHLDHPKRAVKNMRRISHDNKR